MSVSIRDISKGPDLYSRIVDSPYRRTVPSACPSELVDTHMYVPRSPWLNLLIVSFRCTLYDVRFSKIECLVLENKPS